MADRLSDTRLAHLTFALGLHRAMPEDRDTCVSPYSVADALGLLADGAAGATRAELAALLADGDLDAHARLIAESASLNEVAHNVEAPVLSTSAALWTAEYLTILDSYQRTVTARPNGSVRQADFEGDAAGVRRRVNAEVAEQTHGLIKELLPAGIPRPNTAALLVTALYLRASWLHAFPEGATTPRGFQAPSGAREVPTMRHVAQFGYAHTEGWQVVGLGAAGGVQATVLLPDDDLGAAESTLDGRRLAALLEAQDSTRLDLLLPKVSVELHTSLVAALEYLGVADMFTDAADFSGISEQPLAVSEVLHSAVLRLDESGLEGAAATAVAMRLTAMQPKLPDPIPVHVDRPFLLLVRHIDTGAVYFMSRITEP